MASKKQIKKDHRIKMMMIKQAKEKHGNITPCASKENLMQCFTEREEYGELIFWFNRECGSCGIFKESYLK